MSRWRETLCGSVLLPSYTKAKEIEARLYDSSDLLTSGGQYLPYPQQDPMRIKTCSKMVYLPTDSYEVVVYSEDEKERRYNLKTESDFEEIDLIDEVLNNLDHKVIK